MRSKAVRTALFYLLIAIPFAIALWVWLSPLAFVPVPWPDDSAFYFVAKEFFKWPPRWVMLSQAPFEPTYRIFNFNTMPLYPLIIGLGRYLGIDGSFALKIYPLTAWAASGALLVGTIYKKGLPWALAGLLALAWALDPALRWASVLVRPESLIGFFAVALILGMTLGFPHKLRPRGLFDPVAALLALGAYAHFNAVHVVLAVALAYAVDLKRLVRIGLKTTLYLAPWLATVAWHYNLFTTQMRTQWMRLHVGNHWLDSVHDALNSMFQDLGSPAPWPEPLRSWGSVGMWILLLAALFFGLIWPLFLSPLWSAIRKRPQPVDEAISLVPAGGWLVGAIWLWHTKPEVWFTYYLHAAIWTFMGLSTLKLWKSRPDWSSASRAVAAAGLLVVAGLTGTFAYVDIAQARELGRSDSWKWSTYHGFIDCIDHELTGLETSLGNPKPFRVWAPTFPDVTIELSRRHPDWELTRTNDFWNRYPLALQHGREVEAVVVPETIQWAERDVSGTPAEHPDIGSTWMTWKDYFLHYLWDEPGWKPNRYICQRGRWLAWIFMKSPEKSLK